VSEHTLHADLLQEPAAVMGVFLDHASRRARDPNIVVLVEVAGVKAERRGTVAKPRDGALDQTGIAPGMDHFTAGIELDHQRRKTPGIQFAVQHVLAIEEKHMALGIDAMTAESTRDPPIWKWFREGDISLVMGCGVLRPRKGHSKTRDHNRRQGIDADSGDAAYFHERALRLLFAMSRGQGPRPKALLDHRCRKARLPESSVAKHHRHCALSGITIVVACLTVNQIVYVIVGVRRELLLMVLAQTTFDL
jgi:hypothetical protein